MTNRDVSMKRPHPPTSIGRWICATERFARPRAAARPGAAPPCGSQADGIAGRASAREDHSLPARQPIHAPPVARRARRPTAGNERLDRGSQAEHVGHPRGLTGLLFIQPKDAPLPPSDTTPEIRMIPGRPLAGSLL